MRSTAVVILALALGGCSAVSSSINSGGGTVVAGHLGYMKNYLQSSSTDRAEMRMQLESLANDKDAQSRLRYALIISLPDSEEEAVEQGMAMLDKLQSDDRLTPAERWLATLWHGEVETRVTLRRENSDVRVALEQAETKIDQLTMIEQDMENEENGGQ